MIQQDYIERLMQQVAKVLARMIGKDWEETRIVINEIYNDYLPISRKTIIDYPSDDLLDFLVQEKQLDNDQLETIAFLLQTEADHLLNLDEKTTAKDRIKKAFILLQFVDAQSDIYSLERIESIKTLRQFLA